MKYSSSNDRHRSPRSDGRYNEETDSVFARSSDDDLIEEFNALVIDALLEETLQIVVQITLLAALRENHRLSAMATDTHVGAHSPGSEDPCSIHHPEHTQGDLPQADPQPRRDDPYGLQNEIPQAAGYPEPDLDRSFPAGFGLEDKAPHGLEWLLEQLFAMEDRPMESRPDQPTDAEGEGEGEGSSKPDPKPAPKPDNDPPVHRPWYEG